MIQKQNQKKRAKQCVKQNKKQTNNVYGGQYQISTENNQITHSPLGIS